MKRALWLIAAFGLALRWGLAAHSLETIDRWFVPDDTYYTLGIARSIAHGLGPTVDGVVLTNGFQPLLAFLLVPAFAILRGVDAPLRALLLLTALCDAASIVLLGRIAERMASRSAGYITAVLWAISPLAMANALGGLETSLALALQLAMVLSYMRVRELAPDTSRSTRRPRWVALGFCAGLCILARVDSVFLLGAIAALELVELRRTPSAFRRDRLVAVLSSVIVIAPWWGYSALRFGTPIPESGPAVMQITQLHRDLYLQVWQQLGWAVGSVLGAPFVDLPALREHLFHEPVLGPLAFVLLVAILGGVALRWLSAKRGDTKAAGAFLVHALFILLFYALVVPALWFFRRYFAACHAGLTLLIGLLLARGWTRLRETAAPSAARAAWGVPWLAAAALGLAGTVQVLEFEFVTPSGSRDYGRHGAKGYREAALSILAKVPPHAVLGAFQSGALSYYAPATVEVVNLDGVVDHNAREAGRRGTLSDYAFTRHVTLVADWAFNIDAFAQLSANARVFPAAAEIETNVPRQGSDQFSLFQLRWPSGP